MTIIIKAINDTIKLIETLMRNKICILKFNGLNIEIYVPNLFIYIECVTLLIFFRDNPCRHSSNSASIQIPAVSDCG